MAHLQKLVVQWTGWAGAPGLSTFYATDTSSTSLAALRAFFQAERNQFPTAITFKFPNTGFIIDETTGIQTGTWTQTFAADVTGTDVNPYSGTSGGVVNWRTSTVRRSRLMQGRTFLVPLANANYESDGTLLAAFVSGIITNATTMITTTANDFKVWGRPSSPGASDGVGAPITSVRCHDRAQVLRSRRAG